MAYQNIQVLNKLWHQKNRNSLPPLFNILKNEYPALGGNYEVIHHSVFLPAADR
jgi:Fe-S oxidoreductase